MCILGECLATAFICILVGTNGHMALLGVAPLCGNWYQVGGLKNYKLPGDEPGGDLETHPFRAAGLSRSAARAVF